MTRIRNIVPWLLPVFGLARRIQRKRRDEFEMNGLREFLSGRIPGSPGCRFWICSNSVPQVILNGGDYELLYRFKDSDGVPVYVLNMDHPIADLPVSEWRERVLAAAKSVGVDILPLSERALQSARRASGHTHPSLVVREGYEAVLTLGDNYYLSGYDRQEEPPLYFLCQLRGPVTSVAEARESLKPESVKEAIVHGAMVRRQGDLFFIAATMSDDDVRTMGDIASEEYSLPLYGTAHCATRVAQLPNGVMLASGIVRHMPEGRAPDHRDLALGRDWWLVARNTVPADARSPQLAPVGMPLFFDPFWAD